MSFENNIPPELYEELSQEIIDIFSYIVQEKKQLNVKNLSELLIKNNKITNLISIPGHNIPRQEEELKEWIQELERLKEQQKKIYLSDLETDKKIDTLLGIIKTLSKIAKSEDTPVLSSIIENITDNIKSSRDINTETIEIKLEELKNEILRSQDKIETNPVKTMPKKEEEPQVISGTKVRERKPFWKVLFDVIRRPKADKEEGTYKRDIKDLLLGLVLRLQIEKAEELNKKVLKIANSIEKEHLLEDISKTKFEICELVEHLKEHLNNEKENLYELMQEIATRLIATEYELLLAFSNTQTHLETSNQDFHETFTNEINGIENSFNQGDTVEAVKQIVFDKLNNIKKSLKEKKLKDDKIKEEAKLNINRLQEDIDKNKKEIKKIQDTTDIDKLTDVYNRGAFQRQLNEEFKHFKETKSDCSIIAMDVDNLKKINNDFGYDNGDRVLQNVAKVIKDNFPDKYFLARYGGGEFVFILPNINLNKGEEIAEKIRNHILYIDFYYLEQKVEVTVSLGVSTFQEKQTAIQIFQKAHEAMHTAKKKGKNQVVTA